MSKRRRALRRAFLIYLVVQVVAIGAGLTVASLIGSSGIGLTVSNLGALGGVILALRYYVGEVKP